MALLEEESRRKEEADQHGAIMREISNLSNEGFGVGDRDRDGEARGFRDMTPASCTRFMKALASQQVRLWFLH